MKSNGSQSFKRLGKPQVLMLNLLSVDYETNSELQLHRTPRKGILTAKKKLNLVGYHFMNINMYVSPDRERIFGVSNRKIMHTIPY